MIQPGQILAGKYRIERVLGQGGMGVVVAALHVQLDERVAIKFLLPEALESAETVARFAREARAAVKIKSEHVARVSDVGALESGAPYMVMEYLEGQDLSALVRTRGPLAVSEAVLYLLQAIEAIAEAHALGIVHRDLKPSNLFLTRRADGTPLIKVLDFGISKITHGAGVPDAAMTTTNAVLGSPMYMAPEQMVSTRDVDGRADVWALGIVLYQLLAGRAPFDGTTMTELCARILQEPPAPLRAFRVDVPPALEAAILCCLEKDRVRRFHTVADLAGALAPFAGPEGVASAERARRLLPITEVAGQRPSFPSAQTPPPYAAQAPYLVAAQSTHASWSATRARGGGMGPWVAIILAIAALVGGVAVGIAVLVARNVTQRTDGEPARAVEDTATVATPPPTATVAPLLTAAATASDQLAPLHMAPTATANTKTSRPGAATSPHPPATVIATTTATVTAPPATTPATATAKKPDIF
ncbi:MAG TPA: serine/threonine-protein kinase [Polyangiaceae bacterium]|nr:serine/threonine-protein kinase [Polyangiaceae bacterium]